MEIQPTSTLRAREPDISPRAWHGSFQNVQREHAFEPLRTTGTIPEALRGTYYRNGPGLMSVFGHRYRHWFDGDGMVSAVRFDGAAARSSRAKGAVRLLQTEGLIEERRRGKAYFGAFGTPPPGRWNPLRALRAVRGTSKNPANTNLLMWHDRLLALCEIGRPFELDPETLSSIGETDLAGAIPRAFSAHPHRIERNGYVYNIGTQIGRPNAIDVIALRPDGSAGRVTTIELDFPTMIHDFVATETMLVVFVAPLRLKLLPPLLGRASFAESLVWEGERGTEVIAIPLDAPASPIRFRVDAFWAWHIGNAYERGDELVIDFVRYPDYPCSGDWISGIVSGDPKMVSDGRLTRAVLDPKRRTLHHEAMLAPTGEFPRVAPSVDARPHRFLYWTEHSSVEVGRNGPPDTVVRVNSETAATQRFTFGRGHYPSEAVFAPRPGTDDEASGWLLTLVYDAHTSTSYWAVLDAEHVDDGPLCTAHLDQPIPLTFHGQWSPG